MTDSQRRHVAAEIYEIAQIFVENRRDSGGSTWIATYPFVTGGALEATC